jgi:hypothetical protein
MILDKNLSDGEKARKLCEELDRLAAERSPYEPAWQEAQRLVSSVELSFSPSAGAQEEGFHMPKRITNRPANYQETLVAGLCGYAVNPNITWMKLGFSGQELMKAYGVKDWLEEVEQAAYEEFDNSNFYTEMKMAVEQATTFGFGVMHVEEDLVNNRVRFKQINVPEVFLDTNEYDEYETVFRRFFMTVESLVSRFGLSKMHETLRAQWEDTGNTAARARRIEIIHAVFRRKNNKGVSERNTEMPFASYIVDTANKHIIQESGYRSFPYAVFAWDRVGGKKYPLGPAVKAINDILLLHETENTRLNLAQLSAKQPVAVPESMKNCSEMFGKDGYIRPGAVVYYGVGEAVPAGINMGGNYPITLDITRQQADNIKDWFYVDFFLMLQRQGSVNQMTATAVQALQGEKAAVMTNMIVNLKAALQVAVQRTGDIMARQRRLPAAPPALLRSNSDNRVKFVFSSVLSQIQQASVRYQGAQQFLPVAGSIAQLGQSYPPALESLDRFDFDVILQNEARAASMPETAIREDEDVQALRAQRAQAQAAQAQAAEAARAQQTLAQNYNKLNEPPKPGSPAAALFGRDG